MKKILLSILLLSNATISFSQSLLVTGDSLVNGNASDFQIESHLYVKNISSDTAFVYCEKTVIQQNQTGTNNFCWAGTCYGESTMISTKVDTILSGLESSGFAGYYQPWNESDIAVVEYCFYLSSDINDRTCKTVTYDATKVTDLNQITSSDKIGSFFPNPTKEYTNFQFNVSFPSILQIADVLGNVVKIIELEGSGEKTIYLGDLYKGIYFGNLIENGEIVKIKKLIINK